MSNYFTVPLSGVGGNILVGTSVFNVSKWELKRSNEPQNVTTTGSGGNSEYIFSVMDSELTFECNGDAHSPPQAVLDAGMTISSATLQVGQAVGSNSAHAWTGTFLITEATTTNVSTEKVTYAGTAKATGAVTFN